KLSRGPSFALEITKDALNREASMDLPSALEAEAQIQASLMLHPDFREADDAFVEKRDPEFLRWVSAPSSAPVPAPPSGPAPASTRAPSSAPVPGSVSASSSAPVAPPAPPPASPGGSGEPLRRARPRGRSCAPPARAPRVGRAGPDVRRR